MRMLKHLLALLALAQIAVPAAARPTTMSPTYLAVYNPTNGKFNRRLSYSVVSGLSPTQFAITATGQYHAGKSPLTMYAPITLTGNVATTTTVSTLTISTNPNNVSIMTGDQISIAGTACAPCTVTKVISGGYDAWAGPTGTYGLDMNIGTVTGATVTYDPKAIQVIGDISGHGNDLTSADEAHAPRLRVDGLGRNYFLFVGIGSSAANTWIRNLSITGLDSYNTTVVWVGRNLNNYGTSAILSYGSFENGTGSNITTFGVKNWFPAIGGITLEPSPPANLNKLMVGSQLQILGYSIATDDYGTGNTGTNAARVFLNEQSAVVTASSARVKPASGMEMGKNSNHAPDTSGQPTTGMLMYEFAFWGKGEMGNRAAMPANSLAAQNAAIANWSVPPITESLVLVGDSRQQSGYSAGYNPSMLITEPGVSTALPANWRVVSLALNGAGVSQAWKVGFTQAETIQSQSGPFAPYMMLGGGHDRAHFVLGVNDYGNAAIFPNSTNGGCCAGASSLQADDIYNGTPYTASFTATQAASSTTLTTSATIRLYQGMMLSFTNASVGEAINATVNGTTFSTTNTNANAVSGVAATGTLSGYIPFWERVLQVAATSDGGHFKLTVGSEMVDTAVGGSRTAATDELHSKITNNAAADILAALGSTLAANFKVWDIQQVAVGGLKVFGDNFTTDKTADPYYVNNAHQTLKGMKLWVYGGDDPTKSLSYQVQH